MKHLIITLATALVSITSFAQNTYRGNIIAYGGNVVTNHTIHDAFFDGSLFIGDSILGSGSTTFNTNGEAWLGRRNLYIDSQGNVTNNSGVQHSISGFAFTGNGSGLTNINAAANGLATTNQLIPIGPAVPASGHTNLVGLDINGGTTNVVGVDITTLGSTVPATNAMIQVAGYFSGGSGTKSDPWYFPFGPIHLDATNTTYYWPGGYVIVSNTIYVATGYTNSVWQGIEGNTFQIGNGTIVLYRGSNACFSAVNSNGWTMGGLIENFRIDCKDAVHPTYTATTISNLAAGDTLPGVATVTLTNHGFSVGDAVDISGGTGASADYNGVRVVTTVADVNHFTYEIVPNNANLPNPAVGTMKVGHPVVALAATGMRLCEFRNLSLANCTLGMDVRACVTYNVNNVSISKYNEPNDTWTVTPVSGVMIGRRYGTGHNTDASTTGVYNNLVAEGTSDFGWFVYDSQEDVFNAGTSEANYGGVLAFTAPQTEYHNVDLEGNSSWSWRLSGAANLNLVSGGYADASNYFGGTRSVFQRLAVNGTATFASSSFYSTIDNCKFYSLAALQLVAGELNIRNVYFNTGDQPIPAQVGAIYGAITSLSTAPATPPTPNMSSANTFKLSFNGNVLVSPPINPSPNQEISLFMVHDATTNSYSVTLTNVFVVPAQFTNGTAYGTAGQVINVRATYGWPQSTNWYVTQWSSIP